MAGIDLNSPIAKVRQLRALVSSGVITQDQFDVEILLLTRAAASSEAERGKADMDLGKLCMRLGKKATAAEHFHAASLNTELSAEHRADAQAQRVLCLMDQIDTLSESDKMLELYWRIYRIARQALAHLGNTNPLRDELEDVVARVMDVIGDSVKMVYDPRELRVEAAA